MPTQPTTPAQEHTMNTTFATTPMPSPAFLADLRLNMAANELAAAAGITDLSDRLVAANIDPCPTTNAWVTANADAYLDTPNADRPDLGRRMLAEMGI